MPREPEPARRARAHRLLTKVLAAHPDARCALDFDTPFQLLVATILSAQNTDENVNSVTPRLFARFPDAAALAAAAPEVIEEIIHSTGFFRQKTKSLLGLAKALVERHRGEVPDTLEELVELPGVGRKTANLVLGVCFGVPGVVVDTHVGRLVRRWELTEHTDPVEVERDLMQLLPKSQWTAFSHATIFHGRRVCHARRPRCEVCSLLEDCPHGARVMAGQAEAGAAAASAAPASAAAASEATGARPTGGAAPPASARPEAEPRARAKPTPTRQPTPAPKPESKSKAKSTPKAKPKPAAAPAPGGAPERRRRPRRRPAPLWLSAVVGLFTGVAGCKGEGSDIGPRIPPLGTADYRVLVLDDAGRPVVSARVEVEGLGSGFSAQRGRAAVPGEPSGVRLVTVDGALASARPGDRLGQLSLAASTPDGGELPQAIYLPDLAASVGLTVALGAQPAAVALDDTASSGAVLSLAAGTTVELPAAVAAQVELRTGPLAADHLPGALPQPPAGAHLWGAGVVIDPPGVAFGAGAGLSVRNDLALPPGGVADLYYLEPASGAWMRTGSGAVDSSGTRIEATPAAVRGGGLYAFAVAVGAAASVSGRVLDTDGRAVPGALVRAGAAAGRTGGDGSFALGPIAAVDAAGGARTVLLVVHGGRGWLPVASAVPVALAAGANPVGDVVLEGGPVALARLQLITRGRVDPRRRLRLSSVDGLTLGVGVGDEQGIASYPDIAAGDYVGVLTTRVADDERVLRAEGTRFVPAGLHHLDMQVFGQLVPWWNSPGRGGSIATLVLDSVGAGPLQFAAVTRGALPASGFVGLTRENGVVVGEYAPGDQTTAALATAAAGQSVVSAVTFVDIGSGRVELPLQCARHPTGVFEPFGLVGGRLLGSAGGATARRLRATRFLTRADWYEDVMGGGQLLGPVPRPQDPEVTGGEAFRIGVPLPLGHLAAVEGDAPPAPFAPRRVGIAASLRPNPGAELGLDLPLELEADTDFAVAEALVNLHPSLALADLRFDWAVELVDGTLVDLARGVDGGFQQVGSGVSFRLPALQGVLQGATYLLAFGGSAAGGGKTIDQRSVIPIGAGGAPAVRFLEVPDILAPAPGAAVAASGFSVRFTVPPSTMYTVAQLRTEAPAVRDWTAVLPPWVDEFAFRELPPESAQPLAPGPSWTLRVTAVRIETGPLARAANPYHRLLQNWVGLGPAGHEVNAWASTAITITTQ